MKTAKFFSFCRAFSEPSFDAKNLQKRPRFSDTVHSIELDLFLQILETLCGVYFFLF